MHINLENFPFFPFGNIMSECSFGEVILADTYCRNKSFLSSLPMYIGPDILANTVVYNEERQHFSKQRSFFVICTNRGSIAKHGFSLVTLRQNVNQGLQRGNGNALPYCTTKSPSLSNYHRTSPTAVTFSLPHRSKSELLSKVINLSTGSGIPWNEMSGACPKYGCNTTDLLSGFLYLKS